jgi:hypothetical protein
MRIRDPGWRQFGTGMEKSRIRDKPGSATLVSIPDLGSRVEKKTATRYRYVMRTNFLKRLFY